MAFFSVVVTAYNQEKYIAQAIDSVLDQTFGDLEVLVVDDGSTDSTSEILAKCKQKDSRVKIVGDGKNRGVHLARKAGVAATTGKVVLLLDGDDTLFPNALEKIACDLSDNPTQLLQLQVKVPESSVLSAEVTRGYESAANISIPAVSGMGPLKLLAFSSYGPSPNWSVLLQAYDGELLRKAFGSMTNDRMDYAEDVYECFVVRAFAESASNCSSGPHYLYNMDRGISGAEISTENLEKRAEGIRKACDEITNFASGTEDEQIINCARSYIKRVQLSFLHSLNRSDPAELEVILDKFAEFVNHSYLSEALYGIARDKAYELWVKQDGSIPTNSVKEIIEIADRYDASISSKGLEYKQGAIKHMNDISNLKKLQSPAEPIVLGGPRARIYVASHKKAQFPPASAYVPVQVNSAAAANRFMGFRHDDEGDNISDRNARYCELTVQYMAWKNEDADYYGFCHYRRYFNLSGNEYKPNAWGEVMADRLNDDAVQRFGLTNEKLAEALEDVDVLCSPRNDVSKFPDHFSSVRDHWHKAEHLLNQDLKLLDDVVRELQPSYSAALEEVLSGTQVSFCNMYVMRKQIFFDYCEWLFPLLERFEEKRSYEHYSKEALRTVGHLAERLFNVYMLHATRNTDIKVKYAQVVHFENPDPVVSSLPPAFDHDAVPVVFAGDNNYAPQLDVSVLSLAENSSPTSYYDVVIFSADLAPDRFGRIKQSVAHYPNISVRLFNVKPLLKQRDLRANAHISVETYYRFLIQDVLGCYDKVLYLDSDMIILDDVAKLYATDIGDKAIGAMHDVDFLGNLNIKGGNRVQYAKETLEMDDPYAYFQAGVLLLNNKRLRELYTVEDWLKFAEQPLLYNDQDVLNMRLEHEVVYLDPHWNVLMDGGRVEAALRFAPAELFDEYLETRKNPRIIHYAGGLKPWNDPSCDFAPYWWKYAKMSSFYEEVLLKGRKGGPTGTKLWNKLRDTATTGTIGKVGEKLMPIGSRRRETAKRVGKKVVTKLLP